MFATFRLSTLLSTFLSTLLQPGRLLILIQALVLIWLVVLLMFNGVVRGQQLQQEIALHSEDNEDLARRNQRLFSQVEALRNDDVLVVEERARKDLGMVKDEETFFIFVD